MRLVYNILWFEDDNNFVTSLNPLIKQHIEEEGFDSNIKVTPKGIGVKKLIEDDIWNLIVVDLNLATKTSGDILIKKIREYGIYTEVIFYSNYESEFEEIKEKKMSGIDGVFFHVGRRDLENKIKKIINLTIKKAQDVNNMRGLVIAETVELDSKMDDIILKYFIRDKKKIFFKEDTLDQEFFTTGQKFKILNRIMKREIKFLDQEIKFLKGDEKKELERKRNYIKELKTEFRNIEKEIINIRNILSHAKESKDQKNTLISTMGTIIIDNDWCKNKRKELKKHSENLDKIIKHI